MSKIEEFKSITLELENTYKIKNHDYGDSFNKSIEKYGLIAAIVRMEDKMNRLSSLINKESKVNESIHDTLLDLANYSIMTAMYIEDNRGTKLNEMYTNAIEEARKLIGEIVVK